MTFSVTWGLAVLLLMPGSPTRHFGPLGARSPVSWLAVFSLSFSANTVTALTQGRPGLARLLARKVRWRFGWPYYAFLQGPACPDRPFY